MTEKRTRAWRRAQDDRIIQKRKLIIRDVWKSEDYLRTFRFKMGRFRKWNFTCGCGLCKLGRYEAAKERLLRERYQTDSIDGYTSCVRSFLHGSGLSED